MAGRANGRIIKVGFRNIVRLYFGSGEGGGGKETHPAKRATSNMIGEIMED